MANAARAMTAIREMAEVEARLAALESAAGLAGDQLRLGQEVSLSTLLARLRNLNLLVTSPLCDECFRRPAIYCLKVGECPPKFEDGVCPQCGFNRPSVIIIGGGILCDLI
jgi:hypothetical protein